MPHSERGRGPDGLPHPARWSTQVTSSPSTRSTPPPLSRRGETAHTPAPRTTAPRTTTTDLTTFAYVIQAGEDLITAGELAQRLHVTTGAVTGVLNRLERADLITRRPDPKDRRRVRVAARPEAVRRAHALYGPYHERLTALFADYAPEEVAVLTDWFTRATGLAYAYRDELRQRDTEEG